MGREKEVCHGEPTSPAEGFRVTNAGNRVRVIPIEAGFHQCGACGVLYPPGVGQAELQEAMAKYIAPLNIPVSIVEEEE